MRGYAVRAERFVVPSGLLNTEALLAVLLLASLFLFSVHVQNGTVRARAETYTGAFDPEPETTRLVCPEAPAHEMSVRMPGNRMMP